MKYIPSFFILLVLFGCGSGDGGTSTDGVGSPAAPVNEVKLNLSEEVALVTAFASLESFHQVADFTDAIVQNFIQQDAPSQKFFERPETKGGYEGVFEDVDGNQSFSVGDTLRIEFYLDWVSALNANVNGDVVLTLNEWDPLSKSYSVTLVLNDLAIDTIKLRGQFEVRTQREFGSRITTLELNEKARISDSDGELISFSRQSIEIIENYLQGTVSVNGNGDFYHSLATDHYTYVTDTPFYGHFASLPVEGAISVKRDERALGASNLGVDAVFNIFGVNGALVTSIAWEEVSESNSLMAFGNGLYQMLQTPDEFVLLGSLYKQSESEVSTSFDGVVQYQFSAPIVDVITDWRLENECVSLSPDENTDCRIRVNGRLLTIEAEYIANHEDAIGYTHDNGGSLYVYDQAGNEIFFTIKVEEEIEIKPVIIKTSKYFDAESLPTLSARFSSITWGKDIKYEWIDYDGIGITFSSPNSVSTELSLDNRPEKFSVQLRVVDELGKSASMIETFHNIGNIKSGLNVSSHNQKLGTSTPWNTFYYHADTEESGLIKQVDEVRKYIYLTKNSLRGDLGMKIFSPVGSDEYLAPGFYKNIPVATSSGSAPDGAYIYFYDRFETCSSVNANGWADLIIYEDHDLTHIINGVSNPNKSYAADISVFCPEPVDNSGMTHRTFTIRYNSSTPLNTGWSNNWSFPEKISN